MKSIVTLMLAAGLIFGTTVTASAVNFKAKCQWRFGFGMADTNYVIRGGRHQHLDMIKYLSNATATQIGTASRAAEAFYLITNDGLLEFNLDSTWQM